MKYYKKQKIGENLLYVMVWLAILLVPILNSKMMSEGHASLSNILIAWQQIAPYLFIFIIHNAFIVRYVKRHQYMRYVVVDVLFISAVFYGVDILDSILGDFATPEHLISAKHASFTDLAVYWNIVLGLFMTCANTAITMMYQSLRDEQAMEELASRCREEADERLSSLLSRLEFALVLLLCIAVGLVLLSVMLPLLGVLSAVGG